MPSAGASNAKSTFLGACRGIVRDYGVLGFYKGAGLATMACSLAGCVKFASYETFKKVGADPP